MAAPVYKPTRLFSLEQANSMLPLVRVIVRDIAELSRELVDRKQRLELLVRDRPAKTSALYSEELEQIEEDLEKDVARLQAYVDELIELGVELKSPIDGLVDFPSVVEGKPALLCWKLDEPSVLFWHDLDSGFAGRQPIDPDTVTDNHDPE